MWLLLQIKDCVPEPSSGPTKEALIRLRAALKRRGTRGIFSLAKVFRSMDRDGTDTIELPEFKKGIALMKLNLSPQEEEALFRWLDHDGNRSIDYTEFLSGVRGEIRAQTVSSHLILDWVQVQ